MANPIRYRTNEGLRLADELENPPGDVDIADVIAAADTGVRVMLGKGRGDFVPAPGSPFATGKGAWNLAVADLNADGRPDVITSNLESDSVTVLLGRSAPP